jgi:hypothetical protein
MPVPGKQAGDAVEFFEYFIKASYMLPAAAYRRLGRRGDRTDTTKGSVNTLQPCDLIIKNR